MTDETAIEVALAAYGREVRAALPTGDLSQPVVASLRRAGAPARRRWTAARVALVAAVIVLVLASAAYASYRLVFDAGPVTVHRERPPAAAVGQRLALGDEVKPDDPRIRIAVVVPHVAGFAGAPQWWFDGRATDQISLTFPPQADLPEIGNSGVGLLIQEFDGQGEETVRKYVTTSTNAERVHIGSSNGVFLSGGDHALFYLDRNGRYVTSPGRLVGNALIFQRGDLTIRIEAQLPRAQMLQVASSLR